MTAIQRQIDEGAVPHHVSNICPEGTKMYILELGWMECDEAFLLQGANLSRASTKDEPFLNKRRPFPMYAVLIDHPHEGVILWETGSGKDYPKVWGPQLSDIFERVRYEPRHELKAAIEATGHKLEDIKKIIIGHLHRDHAGGLDEFMQRADVEIWCHDKELRSALWSVATGADNTVYFAKYLDLNLNWKTFDAREMDFCQGITLHHLPGHTDGLVGMQINLRDSGTFFFISDHAHIMENYNPGTPQGYFTRDHIAWFQSTQRLRRLEAVTRGRIIPGHDEEVFVMLQKEKDIFT